MPQLPMIIGHLMLLMNSRTLRSNDVSLRIRLLSFTLFARPSHKANWMETMCCQGSSSPFLR